MGSSRRLGLLTLHSAGKIERRVHLKCKESCSTISHKEREKQTTFDRNDLWISLTVEQHRWGFTQLLKQRPEWVTRCFLLSVLLSYKKRTSISLSGVLSFCHEPSGNLDALSLLPLTIQKYSLLGYIRRLFCHFLWYKCTLTQRYSNCPGRNTAVKAKGITHLKFLP